VDFGRWEGAALAVRSIAPTDGPPPPIAAADATHRSGQAGKQPGNERWSSDECGGIVEQPGAGLRHRVGQGVRGALMVLRA